MTQLIRLPIYCSLLAILTACSDSGDDPNPLDHPASSLTVVSTAIPEGAAGSMTVLEFPVTMTEAQPLAVTVRYRTVAGTATAGQDYLEIEGEVVLPPGDLLTHISVEILGDAEEESAETFELNITTEGNVTPTSATATGTIANDDSSCDQPFNKDPNPWLVNGADPLNYAHRGGVIDFPENTLYAFSEVALAGADVLEMDVYQTADNELVILHDLDVDRTSNGSGLVVDLSLADIKQLDAAYWFVPGAGTPHDRPEEDYVFRGIATGEKPPPPGYSANDFRFPTLEEALQRFPDRLINVELKPDLDESEYYEAQIAELMQRYGRLEDTIVASFDDDTINNFKQVAPCTHTGVPQDQGTLLVLGSQGAGIIPPVPEHITFQVPIDSSHIGGLPDDFFLRVVTEDFVSDAHAANLAVQVWTINECNEMLEMMALGVDAIMTDRPLLLADLLATPPEQRRCD